jgi:hypothetical protein
VQDRNILSIVLNNFSQPKKSIVVVGVKRVRVYVQSIVRLLVRARVNMSVPVMVVCIYAYM